jgi:hypothetical protein
MWSAHQQASSQLYSQRNARLQQQATGSGRAGSTANVIDLHGEIMRRPHAFAVEQEALQLACGTLWHTVSVAPNPMPLASDKQYTLPAHWSY